jgi:hypothetical protein
MAKDTKAISQFLIPVDLYKKMIVERAYRQLTNKRIMIEALELWVEREQLTRLQVERKHKQSKKA